MAMAASQVVVITKRGDGGQVLCSVKHVVKAKKVLVFNSLFSFLSVFFISGLHTEEEGLPNEVCNSSP